MIKLSCKESGLECDYIAEGKTVDEVLSLAGDKQKTNNTPKFRPGYLVLI
jgi:hypothetical protein